MSPFLAWGDFHARSRFARSTIPEEKWGTIRSLVVPRHGAIFLVVTSAVAIKEGMNPTIALLTRKTHKRYVRGVIGRGKKEPAWRPLPDYCVQIIQVDVGPIS